MAYNCMEVTEVIGIVFQFLCYVEQPDLNQCLPDQEHWHPYILYACLYFMFVLNVDHICSWLSMVWQRIGGNIWSQVHPKVQDF